jgi:hypothetical protein
MRMSTSPVSAQPAVPNRHSSAPRRAVATAEAGVGVWTLSIAMVGWRSPTDLDPAQPAQRSCVPPHRQ